MLTAVRTPGVHILGHPRGRKYGVGRVTADWDRCSKRPPAPVAIEIDGDPGGRTSTMSLARRALAAGCVFALDSDAHAGEWAFAETAIAHARLAGIPPSASSTAGRSILLEWAASRPASSLPPNRATRPLPRRWTPAIRINGRSPPR